MDHQLDTGCCSSQLPFEYFNEEAPGWLQKPPNCIGRILPPKFYLARLRPNTTKNQEYNELENKVKSSRVKAAVTF